MVSGNVGEWGLGGERGREGVRKDEFFGFFFERELFFLGGEEKRLKKKKNEKKKNEKKKKEKKRKERRK